MSSTRERAGRPVQFHGVPLEERALDSQGNRLPWALEWADDHPNARHQKRMPEEKGSFGKSAKRKGSIRGSRTLTPAKRDNPTIDGFDAALKVDIQYEKDRAQENVISGGDRIQTRSTTAANVPTEVMLYGFSPETQWAAIEFYESVSGGIICEDYDREPPQERRRFQSTFSNSSGSRRALSKEERALAMKYKGGNCWIKVTFDSKEAGERAILNSPHLLHGYWVYAQPYKGQGPDVDEPKLAREENSLPTAPPNNDLSAQARSPSLTGFARVDSSDLAASRNDPFLVPAEESVDQSSESSKTASSATATGLEGSQLRRRDVAEGNVKSATFTRFPNMPRTALRPVNEALLPQLSWSERLLKRLAKDGWIPGDIIGNTVPRLENGDFDWATASFYWKFCFYIDTWLGTDLCGMKET